MPMNFNSVIEGFNVFKNEPVDMVMFSDHMQNGKSFWKLLNGKNVQRITPIR